MRVAVCGRTLLHHLSIRATFNDTGRIEHTSCPPIARLQADAQPPTVHALTLWSPTHLSPKLGLSVECGDRLINLSA